MEQGLLREAGLGHVEEVGALLRDNPDLNVNCRDTYGNTALHHGSTSSRAAVVKLLLAHPDINVNALSVENRTPLSIGCHVGWVSVVRLLLEDPRVDATLPDKRGHNPLWYAVSWGRTDVMKWLIASGRDLGEIPPQTCNVKLYGLRKDGPQGMLERFTTDQVQARREIRASLFSGLAAGVFASINETPSRTFFLFTLQPTPNLRHSPRDCT